MLIFLVFVANEFSALDWQFHTATFTMGNPLTLHGPIGPWIGKAEMSS